MKAQYSVAFTDGDGEPTKLLGFGTFMATPKAAKQFAKEKADDAKKAGFKGFGKKWGYAAVEIRVL